jgi:hypothetical protein
MKISEVMEAIKGWKHAHRDLNKWRAERAAAARTVKLVRVKKDGKESAMHDATSVFDTEQQARQQHERMVSYNPGQRIRHNLYVDNQLVATLDGSLGESATGGATSSGAVATNVNPFGIVMRRPSLFGYVAPKRKTKTAKKRSDSK